MVLVKGSWYPFLSSDKMFAFKHLLLALEASKPFTTVLVLFVQTLKDAGGGGGMIQLLSIDSDGAIVEVDGELIGDMSFGDNESILSTPLSASDIAVGVAEAYDEDFPGANDPLEATRTEEYGGGGSIVHDIPTGCWGDEGTLQDPSSFNSGFD